MASAAVVKKLKLLENICADPYKPARDAAAGGRKVAGYMCSYAPQELLHAAGYYPVRVTGRLGATPRADALLQAFICSFARSSFDAALSGEFDFLDLVLFAHTCDTMQNLADLWQGSCPKMKTVVTSLPNLHTGTAAAAYFRKELDRVRGCIEEAAGPISDEKLVESIALYDKHRTAMKSLYALRRHQPHVLTGAQMMSVVLSSFLLPKEEHLDLVTGLVEKLKGAPPDTGPGQRKVVVAGSVCQAMDFIEVIEAAGCLVIDDDLCMGTRSYVLPSSPGGAPMDVLASMYLGRPPCPAVHKPDFDPAVRLIERVQQAKADGVVFLITKFCDPFAFDYAHLHEQLEKAGIPSLMIEVEQHLPAPEQMRTRLEAFVEVLHTKKG